MTSEDRRRLSDLALRALDIIERDGDGGGEHGELLAATLVFEVKRPGGDDDARFYVNYVSTEGSSPHHIGGLLVGTGQRILSPETDVDDG